MAPSDGATAGWSALLVCPGSVVFVSRGITMLSDGGTMEIGVAISTPSSVLGVLAMNAARLAEGWPLRSAPSFCYVLWIR